MRSSTTKCWASLVACFALALTGCSTDHSFVYPTYERHYISPRYPLKVGVLPLVDKRGTTYNMDYEVLIPLVPFGTGEVDRLDIDYYGTVNYCVEAAKGIAAQLGYSGLFGQVLYIDPKAEGGSVREYDLVLSGTLYETNWKWRSYTYCLSIYCASLYLLGVPISGPHMARLEFDIRLVEPSTNQVLWTKRVEDVMRTGLQGLYYGNPTRELDGKAPGTGYYTRMLKKGMEEAIVDLKDMMEKKGDIYWTVLGSRRRRAAYRAPLEQAAPVIASMSRQESKPAVPASIRNVHVLVIGIGQYDDPAIPSLKYAEKDAEAVYDFFKSGQSVAAPRNVHFVGTEPNEDGLRATKKGITQAIEKYLIRKAVNENDMAVVFFAGHGDQDKAGKSYFFLPEDAEQSSPLSTCLEISEFQRLLDRVPARARLLIADTCHAGAISGTRDLRIRGIERMPAVDKEKVTLVVSSCSPGERAIELAKEKHGLFTWVLLEGLKGNADSACGDGDERITLGELQRWLKLRVPSAARQAGGEQTPVVKVPEGWEDVYLTR